MPIHNLEIKIKNADIINKKKTNITYEELYNNVCIENKKKEEELEENSLWDNDITIEYMNKQIEYEENYTVKDLHHIANYYDISKRKKKKGELIEDIVAFEMDYENSNLVEQRKRLWFYFNEIRNDSYLSKFIMLD